MSIPGSTAAAVKAWLLAQLQTIAEDPGHDLLAGYDLSRENDENTADDMVWVGRVQRQVDPMAMVGSLGAGALSETFEADVVVSVWRSSGDAQAVWERAAALTDDVIAAVRTDPTAGGVVLEARPSAVDQPPSEWDEQGTGRQAEFTVTFTCFAEL